MLWDFILIFIFIFLGGEGTCLRFSIAVGFCNGEKHVGPLLDA